MGKLLLKYKEAEELILNETERRRFLNIFRKDRQFSGALREVSDLEAFFDVMVYTLNDNKDRVFPSCMNELLKNPKRCNTSSLSRYEPSKRSEMKNFLQSELPGHITQPSLGWHAVVISMGALIDAIAASTLSPDNKTRLTDTLESFSNIAMALGDLYNAL